MKKFKIYVYAICKNEEQFVERWVDSMKEADGIFVLDTGSTDNTVKRLKELGVHVTVKKYDEWRFDVARNDSLELVPKNCDICVCTDLDEIFEKGWRVQLEKIWDDNTTRIGYNYNWQLDENNHPVVNFYLDKIHARSGYRWTHPVHEVLEYDGEEVRKIGDEITLNHYPDTKKSRGSYLPLLELSVKERPEDDRNMHYLGREYMYYERWNDCIDILIRHLQLPTATWKDERCASMRFIARSYQALNRPLEAQMWLEKAILEAPYLRDPYVERAFLEYQLKNFKEVIYYCEEALKIKEHKKTYINEKFSWDNTIYDLLSIAYYYQGNLQKALENIDMAIKMAPNDERLKNNRVFFLKS